MFPLFQLLPLDSSIVQKLLPPTVNQRERRLLHPLNCGGSAMSISTTAARRRKAASRPAKPYAEFPLTPHPGGKWMKKIRGKIHYFGRWGRVVDGSMQRIEGDGWKEALEEYKVQADDLHAGRTPRLASDGLTVADLCNRFLTAKTRKLEAGEIGRRMFADYREITDLVVVNLGKNQPVNGLAAEDFAALRVAMAKRWGPVRLDVSITRIKSVFKFAFDNALIDRPIRYGAEFAKPSRAVLRKHRAQSGPKMLEADQLRRLLAHLEANHALRAMVLLGLNAGFGNTDVASLPLKALDLAGGWVCYPRPKTGVARRCP